MHVYNLISTKYVYSYYDNINVINYKTKFLTISSIKHAYFSCYVIPIFIINIIHLGNSQICYNITFYTMKIDTSHSIKMFFSLENLQVSA